MTFFSRPPQMPMQQQPFRGPRPMPRQRFGNPMPMQNAYPQQRREPYPPFYPQNPNYGPQQQPFNPYQQMQGPGYGGGLSDNLNTIMGHVGTVTNGINAMQQVGSLMNLFRV